MFSRKKKQKKPYEILYDETPEKIRKLENRMQRCEKSLHDFSQILSDELEVRLRAVLKEGTDKLYEKVVSVREEFTRLLMKGSEWIQEDIATTRKDTSEKMKEETQQEIDRLKNDVNVLAETIKKLAVDVAVLEELGEEYEIDEHDETPITFTFVDQKFTFPCYVLNEIPYLKMMHGKKRYTLFRDPELFDQILLIIMHGGVMESAPNYLLDKELEFMGVKVTWPGKKKKVEESVPIVGCPIYELLFFTNIKMIIGTSFTAEIISIILKDTRISKYYIKSHPNTKYDLHTIIDDIIYILKTGIPWRSLRSKSNYRTVYFHFKRFVKHNIFVKLFKRLRNKFFKRNNSRFISVDTTLEIDLRRLNGLNLGH